MNKYENGVKKVTIDDVLQVTDEEVTKKLSKELKMNKPKRKTYVKKYGWEHTERYIQALQTYINYLEKALDKACEELENYSSHSYPPEYIIKEDWKEWLLKDE